MLGKLSRLPAANAILPFVRLSYAQPSMYAWESETGDTKMIPQGEGGEQGDPLMPLLFSLGIHDALAEVATHLEEGEQLCAFLDDVYAICQPHRVRHIYDLLATMLAQHAGIQLHQGKTRVWNRGGSCPPGLTDLGPDVWSPAGIKVLGTPLGTPEFTAEHL